MATIKSVEVDGLTLLIVPELKRNRCAGCIGTTPYPEARQGALPQLGSCGRLPDCRGGGNIFIRESDFSEYIALTLGRDA